jgi:LL-diaminopimelate aminotransferase
MAYPVNRLTTNFFDTINENIDRLIVKGADVIRLDIGSPDMPPPPHIIKALSESAESSESHGYQSHRGTLPLREAWVSMYKRVHGVDLDQEAVLPLLGSKDGVFHLSMAVLSPGDVVLVPDPGYQTYIQGAKFTGANPVALPLLPENDYLPDFSAIPPNIARQTKILWLNYPNNPTTAIAPLETFTEAVSFCKENNILLCHDAAYSQVTYDSYRAPSVLQVPGAAEVAIEFNSLSKSHNMAGWRVGAAVGQVDGLAALLKLKTHVDSGQFLPAIQAAVSALSGDQTWLIGRNTIYQERRDVVVSALRRMGIQVCEPKATIYVWFRLPEKWDSDDFVLTLLEKANVSLAPGTIFGHKWDKYVRLSLTQPGERIREAMERMSAWI